MDQSVLSPILNRKTCVTPTEYSCHEAIYSEGEVNSDLRTGLEEKNDSEEPRMESKKPNDKSGFRSPPQIL
jgi:hypothetical protein